MANRLYVQQLKRVIRDLIAFPNAEIPLELYREAEQLIGSIENQTIFTLARGAGMNPSTVYNRVQLGWSVEDALNPKLRFNPKRNET